jgi:hypothetical protein
MSKLGREAQRYYSEHTVFCNNCCGGGIVILPMLNRSDGDVFLMKRNFLTIITQVSQLLNLMVAFYVTL